MGYAVAYQVDELLQSKNVSGFVQGGLCKRQRKMYNIKVLVFNSCMAGLYSIHLCVNGNPISDRANIKRTGKTKMATEKINKTGT
jgi:hypothetical protein